MYGLNHVRDKDVNMLCAQAGAQAAVVANHWAEASEGARCAKTITETRF